jgi:hypothetical protein
VKLRILIALILTPLCLAAPFVVANSAPVRVTATKALEDASWLRESFYRRFPDQRQAVDKELQVLRVNLDEDTEPEYLAWLSLDRLNGSGILFDRQGSAYQSVYQINDPIYQVSFDQPTRSIIISSGNGGTGIQHNWFHVIQKVGGNYREVWAGIEQSSTFGLPPFTQRYGTVAISQDPALNAPVLRHATRTTVLNQDNTVREVRDSVDTYVFKPDQGRFVPNGQISGVSNHLVLDRPEAFVGEAVKVLVVGLKSDQLKGAKIALTNSAGKVVASSSDQQQSVGKDVTFWLPFSRDIAPGTYTVQLTQASGNQQKVLDRTSFAIRKP